MVIDREKVLAVLWKRFPQASTDEIAAAANAIVGLDAEYAPIEVGDVSRLDCLAGSRAYSVSDVRSGRLRLYRRLTQ